MNVHYRSCLVTLNLIVGNARHSVFSVARLALWGLGCSVKGH